jgi:hypothetical protein
VTAPASPGFFVLTEGRRRAKFRTGASQRRRARQTSIPQRREKDRTMKTEKEGSAAVQATDERDGERAALLASVNVQLRERGLKPFAKLGDAAKGEFEITGLQGFVDHAKRFFTDAIFTVRFPNGKDGVYTVRFNANSANSDGAVFVVLLNGKFVIVKQWRLPLSRWTYEVPRGFSEKLDNAQIASRLGTLGIGDLPLGAVVRELGEEVMADAKVTSITHLGNVAQDTSFHTAAPAYFLVQIATPKGVDEASLRGTDDEISRVLLWDAAKLQAEWGQKICDSHTITALSLAFNHIDKLPRLK